MIALECITSATTTVYAKSSSGSKTSIPLGSFFSYTIHVDSTPTTMGHITATVVYSGTTFTASISISSLTGYFGPGSTGGLTYFKV